MCAYSAAVLLCVCPVPQGMPLGFSRSLTPQRGFGRAPVRPVSSSHLDVDGLSPRVRPTPNAQSESTCHHHVPPPTSREKVTHTGQTKPLSIFCRFTLELPTEHGPGSSCRFKNHMCELGTECVCVFLCVVVFLSCFSVVPPWLRLFFCFPGVEGCEWGG